MKKTTKIAISGIIEFIPSAFPLSSLVTLSVSHALKHASFADEPKKVITQSIIITSVTQTADADAAIGKSAPIISTLISAKLRIEIPQRI